MTANFGGVRGAIAGCHCSVLEGDDQALGSGRGAIAGCHYSVLWLGGAFFLYIDNTKIGFGIWGLCWYIFCCFFVP